MSGGAKKYSILRWSFFALLLFFIFIILSLFAINNLPILRKNVIKLATNIINNSLIARIEIEDLKFKSFNSLRVINFRLITDGDTLIQFEELDLKVKLSELWHNKILVRNIYIKSPIIKLIRNPNDSLWNFEKIAEPTDKTEPTGKSPIIEIRNFIVQNAKAKIYDPLFRDTSLRISPLSLNFQNLNFHFKANFDINNHSAYVQHHKISFQEKTTGLTIDSIKFALNIKKNFTKLDYFELTSNSSKIKAVAEFLNFNPLDTKKYNVIENAKFSSNIRLMDFNLDIPKKIAIIPLNEDQRINARIALHGTVSQIYVDLYYLTFGNSSIQGHSQIELDEKQRPNIVANLKNSIVYQSDLQKLVKEDLQSLPNFKYFQIENLDLSGNQDKFEISSKISTPSGNVDFNANIVLQPKIQYKIYSKFYSLDFASLITNDELKSKINGNFYLEGSGDQFGNILAKTQITLLPSEFRNIQINSSQINIKINKNEINLDTIIINFPNLVDTLLSISYPSFLKVDGKIDLQSQQHPKYKININAENLDFSRLIQNKTLPTNVSFSSIIEGKNSLLDEIELSSNFKLNEITFADLTFLPFELNFAMNKKNDNTRTISLNFMQDTILVDGKFSIEKLANFLPDLVNYSLVYFQTRYNEFVLKKTDSTLVEQFKKIAKSFKLPEIDASIYLKFNNLFFLNSVLKDLNINTSLDFKGFIKSSYDNAFVDFSHCKIGQTQINQKDLNLEFDDFIVNFTINLSKVDTLFMLSFGNFNIDDLSSLKLNKISLLQPKLNFLALDNKFTGEFGIRYDTLASSFVELEGKVLEQSVDLKIPKVELEMLDSTIVFRNLNDIKINFDIDGIKVDKFNLIGKNNEKIYIDATLKNNSFENTKIRLENYKSSNYNKILQNQSTNELQNSQFNLNYLEFRANGSLQNPNYEMEFLIDTSKVLNTDFGKITAQFSYLDSNVIGIVELKEKLLRNNSPLIIKVLSLPINLSLSDRLGKLWGEYKFRLELDTFRIGILTPFIPIVRNLSGIANGFVELNGSDFDNYHINGSLQIPSSQFIFEANNLPYALTANLKMRENTIYFDTVKIKNYGINSQAELFGRMQIQNNELNLMDLNVKANNFLVLDEVSKKKIPQFYGKLSLSTKNAGMKIYGHPNNLNISGDIQINPSNLVIANLDQMQSITKTNFDYKVIGDKRTIVINTTTDTTKNTEKKPTTTPTQLPNVEMNVYIPRNVDLTIDLGPIGEVVAILGSSDPTTPLVFVLDKDNPLGQLYGELIIKEGSTLNSYKKMNAKGTISFQSRDITNPMIDIIGEYNGKIDDHTNPVRYTIKVMITGTAQQPRVKFDYTVNGVAPQAEPKKIEENALYLLLFGQLPGMGDAVLEPNVVNKLSSAGISSVASRSISDLLLKTGVIESADFQIDSQDFEKTKINFKGKLYGSLNWSLGGSIADLTKNNQITIEMPLSANEKLLNQIIWLISYSTNLNSTVFDPDEKNWEMKLKFGGSW